MRGTQAGTRFGRLLTLSRVTRPRRHIWWLCVCDCGNFELVQAYLLLRGRQAACSYCSSSTALGKKRKYGNKVDSVSKTYIAWKNMRQRCENPNHTAYKDYGERGIGVCEEWGDYEKFLSDMGEAPENMSIDRIDNDKGYSAKNCRWASRTTQARNKRSNVYLELNGERMLLIEWSHRIGISVKAICYRVKKGWSDERVLAAPKRAESQPQGKEQK